MSNKTLGLIKPCAVGSELDELILSDIREAKLNIIASKRVRMTDLVASEFYAEHKGKPFYESLIEFMTSGDIIAFVIEGDDDVVTRYRALMGATNPANAEEGTLRKKYAQSLDHNAVHGSDSPSSAAREIQIIFG
ncbi:nucleoside diphosphate kinase [Vibrio chagasii]|nr:nucleoside diphosphate kinase [Vibrio chagasii]